MNNAKGLAKNPLGIIALFISLIYGFACLVLGLSANKLENSERIPLIWFLIFFPVLVLIAFVYLVSKHHRKLYAPSDFRDDKSFLEASDSISKEHKLINEFREFSNESSIDKNGEKNIKEKMENEVKIHVEDRPQVLEFNVFRKHYMQIESNALNYLERKYNAPLFRNVRIRGLFLTFDGVIERKFNNEKEAIVIEVKFIRTGWGRIPISISDLKRMYNELVYFNKKVNLDRKLKFLIFLVFESKGLFPLVNESELLDKFEKSEVEVLVQSTYLETLEKEITAHNSQYK